MKVRHLNVTTNCSRTPDGLADMNYFLYNIAAQSTLVVTVI